MQLVHVLHSPEKIGVDIHVGVSGEQVSPRILTKRKAGESKAKQKDPDVTHGHFPFTVELSGGSVRPYR
jgi:hypothetical protein